MELSYCRKWRTCIAILTWTCLLKIAQSCNCFPKHPQQHFCQSDYAVRATILNSHVVWPTADHIVRDGAVSLSSDVIHSAERAYKVLVNQVYKGDDIHRRQVMYLYTPYQELLCGINGLEIGKQYMFMGSFDKVTSKHSFNQCNFHHRWSDITPKQLEGLRHGYKNNCDVKIVVCGIDATCHPGLPPTPTPKGIHPTQKPHHHHNKQLPKVHSGTVCQWDPWKGTCHTQEGICKRHHSTGAIHWDLSEQYELCQANLYPDLIGELLSGELFSDELLS